MIRLQTRTHANNRISPTIDRNKNFILQRIMNSSQLPIYIKVIKHIINFAQYKLTPKSNANKENYLLIINLMMATTREASKSRLNLKYKIYLTAKTSSD